MNYLHIFTRLTEKQVLLKNEVETEERNLKIEKVIRILTKIRKRFMFVKKDISFYQLKN